MSKIQYAYDEISNLLIHISQVGKANKDNFALKCPKCKESIILKDGDFNVKHFSHKPNSEHVYSNSESEQHEIAKLLLADFFNKNPDNLSIQVCKCHMVDDTFDDSLNECKAEIEYKVANGIADIALINSKKEVICIFEIKHTHATRFRKGTWFEFDANEVIRKLLPNPDEVTLTDIKPCICPKIPIKELAVTLGYCSIINRWDELDRRVTLLCLREKSYEITYSWDYPDNTYGNEWRRAWRDFESRQKCIRCERHHIPSRGKPYCISCYKRIQNDDVYDVIEKFLPKEPLDEINKLFKWLFTIPRIEDSKYGSCSVCNNSCTYVWYIGPRKICIDCVVSRHKKKYPSGKYLSRNSDDDVAKILATYKPEGFIESDG